MIGTIALGDASARAKDLLGRVYEYFLGQFALAEGEKGGQFYTPQSIVRLLVEMLEPYKGRVFDPCCGSGGMFVQSEKFVLAHSGKIDDISIYGQESNQTTYRLARMNLSIRGLDSSNIKWNIEGSFLRDAHPDLKGGVPVSARAALRPRGWAAGWGETGLASHSPPLATRIGLASTPSISSAIFSRRPAPVRVDSTRTRMAFGWLGG